MIYSLQVISNDLISTATLIGIFVIPISQMKKLRLRKDNGLEQRYTSIKVEPQLSLWVLSPWLCSHSGSLRILPNGTLLSQDHILLTSQESCPLLHWLCCL